MNYLGKLQQWNRGNLLEAGFTLQEAKALLGSPPLRINPK